MRILVALFGLLSYSGITLAEEVQPDTDAVVASIDRGLAFVVQDALAWKKKHNCVSCHHAGLVVWSMQEAKQSGHGVDEPVLAELTEWIAGSGDGKTSVPRPANIPKAFNEKAVYLALALGSNPQPDATSQKGLEVLLSTVKSDQVENGSWLSWPDTRPPIFGNSDTRATILAALALLPAANSGDEHAKQASEKAVHWLLESPADEDLQSMALRLVLWQRLGRTMEERQALAQRILASQNNDGGWSQTDQMPSDAWATGQALYALAHAETRSDSPDIQRAQEFLVKAQRDNGSWPMTSRPIKPDGEGSKNLVPITGAGAAWAVMGLVRSR